MLRLANAAPPVPKHHRPKLDEVGGAEHAVRHGSGGRTGMDRLHRRLGPYCRSATGEAAAGVVVPPPIVNVTIGNSLLTKHSSLAAKKANW